MDNNKNLFWLVNCRFMAVTALLGMMCVSTVNHAFAQQPQQNTTVSAPSQDGSLNQPQQNPPTNNTPSSTSPATDKAVKTDSQSLSNQSSTTENPYGLKALWSGGDIVSRLTLLVLAIMSVGSWYVIVMKVVAQNRVVSAGKEIQTKQFWKQSTLKKGTEGLNANSSYRYISENGIDALMHYEGSLQETIDLYSWVSMALHRALDTIQGKLQSGLAFLGTVGSTAPFVGLFGTVWGIHHALSAISIAGQATLDKVAGPVGEALIMTAIGLVTAVPAVLGYNFLVRRNKVIMDQTRNFAADVQTVLLGGNLRNTTTVSEQRKNVS